MSDQMKITCPCGKSVHVERGGTLGEIAKESGYVGTFNVSNGLESVWICPTCWDKCRPALATLKEVFGDQVGYIHFSNLFRRPDVL